MRRTQRGEDDAGTSVPGAEGEIEIDGQTESYPNDLGGGRRSPRDFLTYDFDGRQVRTVQKGGEVWFVATDVCAVLEHTNPSVAIGRLEDDERGVSTLYTRGGPQEVSVINESGLYGLIFTSRKPEARTFRRWVTGVVLPSIRRNGRYDPSQAQRGTDLGTFSRAGRYVTMVREGMAPQTYHSPYAQIVNEMTEADVRALAHSVKLIEVFWHKVEGIGAAGWTPRRGSLERDCWRRFVREANWRITTWPASKTTCGVTRAPADLPR